MELRYNYNLANRTINKKSQTINTMKKTAIIIALALAPIISWSQNAFDSFENKRDVTSVVVTKNMIKLLSKMDLDSSDPEAQAYLNLVNNLENIKVFITENPTVSAEMDSAVRTYLSQSNKLGELMRVKDKGQDIKFYSKEGKNDNFVSELLMHLTGNVDGKQTSVIMSITGNIDLKQISKLTSELKVPGSEQLKNLEKNKNN